MPNVFDFLTLELREEHRTQHQPAETTLNPTRSGESQHGVGPSRATQQETNRNYTNLQPNRQNLLNS